MPSPNMLLPIPVPSQTGGPQYAQDEVSCFNAIDSHNHTSGQGTQIPLNALNINQDLDMNGLSVINLRALELQNQISSPGSASLYMLGDDLYFSDGSGSYDVQITLDGSVAVSGAVGFSGLPSGTASAAFLPLNAAFRFQSATDTGATMDTGPLKVRNTTASSNSITISPPVPLAADYDLTLPPALPASDSFLVSDVAGALSFQSTAFVLPPGVMMAYGGTSAPTGWLFCNGTVVAQASYTGLYAVVGNSFNTGGEGAGNFRLPDMRGRAGVGAGTGSGLTARTLGEQSGVENSLEHTHGVTDVIVRMGTNPAFPNRVFLTTDPASFTIDNELLTSTNVAMKFGVVGSISMTRGVNCTGSTDAVNESLVDKNMQPFLGLNYIIKY